jgi:RHS repeat-associated protein
VDSGATTTYSYDAANELETEVTTAKRITYSYDANGNTDVVNDDGGLTTYSWDVENHMTLVELSGGTLNTITYDGDGKRREYEDSAGLRTFIWDGENILLQTDSGGATNRDYTYNPQGYGHLISQSNLFHHYDALGSTMQLTDASESVDTSYLYKAFGEQTILTGSDPNRFTWVGRLGYYRQPDTEDYWVRARVYEPQMGRWRRRDPVLLDEHHYAYVDEAPNAHVDPSGLAKCGRTRRRRLVLWRDKEIEKARYGQWKFVGGEVSFTTLPVSGPGNVGGLLNPLGPQIPIQTGPVCTCQWKMRVTQDGWHVVCFTYLYRRRCKECRDGEWVTWTEEWTDARQWVECKRFKRNESIEMETRAWLGMLAFPDTNVCGAVCEHTRPESQAGRIVFFPMKYCDF